jgi:CspA family cold shock protein
MSTGKVKFFNEDKGFGFITEDETGKEFFVHITEVNGDTLNEGDNVEFEIAESDKGLNAVEVNVIND